MSSTSSTVTEKHFAYLAQRTRGDDEFLLRLKEAARAAGLPEIWIAPEQASLIEILLALRGARDVVEVGTLAGYAAIRMARAIGAGGTVKTIEVEPCHAAFARQWIAASDVAGRVEVLEGDARAILPTLPAESADACFIDADKAGYLAYVDECVRILRPRGLLLVDNAFAFGRVLAADDQDPEVVAIRRCNDAIAARTDLRGVIVPLGDGCWVAVKEGR
ncbi:MAG TPA: O-methyltransferase [Planctomycetota bacterium]|nr:O-methyltransferase [Planctomycetota bacterium]